MKIAVCILAHHKPALLKRLVDRIKKSDVEVYIHLDAKSNLDDFKSINNAVFIKNRTKVYWGGRSMIVAMYNLIEYIVKNTNCDYLIFISGQDFPIANLKKCTEYINPLLNYIEYQKLPRADWYMGGVERLKYYYICNSSLSLLSRITIKFQKQININKNFKDRGFAIYGGSQWININIAAAEYILSKWKEYYKFFKFCNIPDELIFHTMLMNSPIKDTIINDNLRFIKFIGNDYHPIDINKEHIKDLINSKVLFCRKVSDDKDFEEFDNIANNFY